MRMPNNRASWMDPVPMGTSSHGRPGARDGPGPLPDRPPLTLADDRAVDDEVRRAERAAVRAGDRSVLGEVLDVGELGLAGRGDARRPRREVHVPQRAVAP